MYSQIIKERIEQSISTKQKLLENETILLQIEEACRVILESYKRGGKVLLCGNGGSASDALHITGELVGRFIQERKAYSAIALNADVATMTAIANDYGYDAMFERQVEGNMKPQDVLIGISTSGNSINVLRALQKAKSIGGKTIALLGREGGAIKNNCDIAITIPEQVTARVQESHIMIGHIICEIVERELS